MRWATAISARADLESALDDAIQSLQRDFAGGRADLALLFVSAARADDAATLPARLLAELPARVVLGCTAIGVIGGGREIEHEPAVALTVAELPDTTVTPFALAATDLPDDDAPPQAWHDAIGVAPQPRPEFILLADPFSCPAESLVTGLDYAYPHSTKLGGLASAATRPGENLLFQRGEVRHDGAIGVALAGNVRIDPVVAQGCRPLGKPLRITSCRDNLLIELDGKPPLHVLQELATSVEERDQELMTRSLLVGIAVDGLGDDPDAGGFLVRNLIGADSKHGVLAVGERLREGQSVQFLVRDDRTSAEDLSSLLRRFGATPPAQQASAALLFSCTGRGIHLYRRPDHDSDLIHGALGPIPLAGFFCAGEIGPVGGATRLLGYTSSIGVIGPARR